jgi:hypothetical protein
MERDPTNLISSPETILIPCIQAVTPLPTPSFCLTCLLDPSTYTKSLSPVSNLSVLSPPTHIISFPLGGDAGSYFLQAAKQHNRLH